MDADEDSDEPSRPTTASSSRTAPPAAAPVAVTAPSPPSSEGSAPDIAMLRRGSAPAVITTEPISPPAIIPLGPPDAARRQSLETASRLVAPPSSFRNVSRSQLSLNTRPSRLQHSVTAPMSTAATPPRAASSINRWVDQTAAANAAASTHAPRAPAPQNLAGPLPAADFSFGAPPAVDNAQQPAATGSVADVDYPDNYSRSGSLVDTASYPRHPSLAEAYLPPQRSNSMFLSQPRFSSIASSDDGSAPPMSRFASFASSASGASSSTYYSTLATPDGWSRRSSV